MLKFDRTCVLSSNIVMQVLKEVFLSVHANQKLLDCYQDQAMSTMAPETSARSRIRSDATIGTTVHDVRTNKRSDSAPLIILMNVGARSRPRRFIVRSGVQQGVSRPLVTHTRSLAHCRHHQ